MNKQKRLLNFTADLTGLCMHYVLLLRTLAFWGHALILWLLTRHLQQDYPFKPVLITLFVLWLLTLLSWYWARVRKTITETFVFLQLLLDIVTLTILLYFTGGAANPFVSLFMLPVIFAAAMLQPVFIWTIAMMSIACYTLLMYFYQPIPIWSHHGQGFAVHVWGMWYGFLLSAGLVAYFVTRIGTTLRERDRLLSAAREQALETDKLVALGTLAAGTAHELGTPLGTIAILSKDLEASNKDNPGLYKKLRLLRGQVSRCKEILSSMAISAGQSQADSGEPVKLDNYLQQLFDTWSAANPDTTVLIEMDGLHPAPQIIADQSVTQAIISILNNAADASSEWVKIQAEWSENVLMIYIQDQGEGISAELAEKLGSKPFISTKPSGKGLGLGFYLAQNILSRLGGNVSLTNRAVSVDNKTHNNGVTAEITLPLSQLKTYV